WGDKDRLIVPAYAHAFKKGIPNSELVVIPEAGHMVTLEKTEQVISAIGRLDEGDAAVKSLRWKIERHRARFFARRREFDDARAKARLRWRFATRPARFLPFDLHTVALRHRIVPPAQLHLSLRHRQRTIFKRVGRKLVDGERNRAAR